MCGRNEASIEVEIPHATIAHKKGAGISAGSLLAAAICRDCTRATVAAWARHGAPDAQRLKDEYRAKREGGGEGEDPSCT
jgi:hypothetical protein